MLLLLQSLCDGWNSKLIWRWVWSCPILVTYFVLYANTHWKPSTWRRAFSGLWRISVTRAMSHPANTSFILLGCVEHAFLQFWTAMCSSDSVAVLLIWCGHSGNSLLHTCMMFAIHCFLWSICIFCEVVIKENTSKRRRMTHIFRKSFHSTSFESLIWVGC